MFIHRSITLSKQPSSSESLSDRHLKELTIISELGNAKLIISNVYIPFHNIHCSGVLMAYADDITITSTHTSTSVSKKYIQPYLQKVFAWTKQSHTKSRQNNLHSVHAGPCRIHEQSGPKNTQQCSTHGNAPKGSG